MDDSRPKGAYSGSGGSGDGAKGAGGASGARKGSGFMPGGTSLGGGSGIGTLAVEGASGGEMDDFRPEEVRFGRGGSEFGATVVGEASGAREESDFVPGGTSLGGASGNETLAVEGASGGEMDDFRPEEVRFGRGGSEFGATVVGRASESEESDFLRTSLRASSSRRGASLMIFSCLSFKIFSFLAQTCHFPKSLSTISSQSVSEGSRKSPNSEEANETGGAGLLGSEKPESGRSGRIAGRVMGPKGRSSRRNFVSGSEYGATSDMVAPRSSGGPRGDGLFIAGVPRPMAP